MVYFNYFCRVINIDMENKYRNLSGKKLILAFEAIELAFN